MHVFMLEEKWVYPDQVSGSVHCKLCSVDVRWRQHHRRTFLLHTIAYTAVTLRRTRMRYTKEGAFFALPCPLTFFALFFGLPASASLSSDSSTSIELADEGEKGDPESI